MGELTSKAIQKIAKSNIYKHAVTNASGVLGILGGCWLVMFGLSPVAIGVASVGTVIAFGSLGYNFLRKDIFVQKVMRDIRAAREKEKNESLARLKKDLDECADAVVKADAEQINQAKELYDAVEKLVKTFYGVLDRKMDPGEMTYNLYAGSVDDLHMNILDNLERITGLFRIIAGTNQNRVFKRMDELEAKGKKKWDEHDKKEYVNLKEVADRLNSQIDKITEINTKNEVAMNGLGKLISEVEATDMKKGRANAGLEQSLKRLQDLAEQAKIYEREQ